MVGWLVADDAALFNACVAGKTMLEIARTTQFSSPFTAKQCEERWGRMLFDAETSRKSAKQINAVKLGQGSSMGSEITWAQPSAPVDPEMVSFTALEEDVVYGAEKSNAPFATETSDQIHRKDEIGMLLLERQWETSKEVDHDPGVLALIRGNVIRYEVRKPEIVFGRATRDFPVDINASDEGNADKVSRKQAVIRLHADGKFTIENAGTRVMHVNGHAVQKGEVVYLSSQSLIAIAGIKLIFETFFASVERYLRKVRTESAAAPSYHSQPPLQHPVAAAQYGASHPPSASVPSSTASPAAPPPAPHATAPHATLPAQPSATTPALSPAATAAPPPPTASAATAAALPPAATAASSVPQSSPGSVVSSAAAAVASAALPASFAAHSNHGAMEAKHEDTVHPAVVPGGQNGLHGV